AELLAGCPQLKVLATSRAPLRLRAERELAVPPLPLAAPAPGLVTAGASNPAALGPAVELFVERASTRGAQLSRGAEELAACAEICLLLDGLPLAIELAAARSTIFAPPELLARLRSSEHGVALGLLRGGPRDLPARQQTLQATIAWSYGLLEPAARRLLARLSAFAGGFTVEAAEAVCGEAPDPAAPPVIDLLADLVEQSLARRREEPAGETRFHLLETVRAFARGALEASGEGEAARLSHAHHMLALARQLAPAARYVVAPAPPPRLERELDNLRAALAWCLKGGDPPLGLNLAVRLTWFWDVRRHWREGYGWLVSGLAACGAAAAGAPEMDGLLIRARQGAAWLAHRFGDMVAAEAHTATAMALAEALGDRAALGRSLCDRAIFGFLESADLTAAAALLGRSLGIFRDQGDQTEIAQVLMAWSDLANSAGDYAQALELSKASVETARATGDPDLLVSALDQLALAHLGRDEYDQAIAVSEEGLAIIRGLDGGAALPGFSYVHEQVALRKGDYGVAVACAEQILTFWRDLGDPLMQGYALDDLARAVAMLGDRERAQRLYGESIKWLLAVGDRTGVLYRLQGLAALDLAQGYAERAARLCGALEALLAEARHELIAPYRQEHEQSLAALSAQLGPEAMAAAMDAGRRLTLEQAVGEALAPARPTPWYSA
ncbi:MAG TPA: tetratricopeptide repeat protein, partial [Chloroflexaceae bacterium]|nr:tetratricopeptide repeat protein [Chloroflexaceae bacterium]